MRYWLYCDDRLVGPCEREEIPAIEGFDADTLVCPEEQPGAYPRQWRRAAQIPDLSIFLLPAQAAAPHQGWGPLLPPEPTLSDVAEVNSLQEKVRLLANAVHLLRDQMNEEKARAAELKDDLERKGQALRETQLKLSQAEERLRGLDPLRAETSTLQEDLHAVQARLAELDALKTRLDEHAGRIEDLHLACGRFEKGEDRLIHLEKGFLKAREEAAAALSKAVGQLLSEIMAISTSRAPVVVVQAPGQVPGQAAPAAPPPAAPAPKAETGEFGLDTVDLFGEEGGKPGDLL